ncbi:suppressor of lurcher protein 1 isoform X4 [Cherax quadricarinatus]|uniref:suppressor of lurcher protein 1 isoform X4 n=1 Tax=Cherax quadricarinatus TaxID=27406 RepID=UPI00387E8F9A
MQGRRILVLVATSLNVASCHFNSVSGGCNVTILSEEENEGLIASPGYPDTYPPSTTCTYTFRGSQYQRVQLIFTSFSLRNAPPHLKPHESCQHTDAVAVYNLLCNTTMDLQEVDTFCGLSVPLPVMSSTSDLGIEGGQQPIPGICKFVYNSSYTSNGTLYSPNPGGYYPQDTTCTYLFYGRPGEAVRLIFKYFDVEGVMPCNEATESDSLEFSNFPSADRKIPSFCGSVAPTVIQSDGAFFRLVFKSNSKFSGTGFTADYQFLDMSYQPYTIKKHCLPFLKPEVGIIRSVYPDHLMVLVLCNQNSSHGGHCCFNRSTNQNISDGKLTCLLLIPLLCV